MFSQAMKWINVIIDYEKSIATVKDWLLVNHHIKWVYHETTPDYLGNLKNIR